MQQFLPDSQENFNSTRNEWGALEHDAMNDPGEVVALVESHLKAGDVATRGLSNVLVALTYINDAGLDQSGASSDFLFPLYLSKL